MGNNRHGGYAQSNSGSGKYRRGKAGNSGSRGGGGHNSRPGNGSGGGSKATVWIIAGVFGLPIVTVIAFGVAYVALRRVLS